MPGHALEIFNETDKVEIYHHITSLKLILLITKKYNFIFREEFIR